MLNKTRLLTPGPTPLPEVVRLALAKDMIHHRKAEFSQLMLAVQEKLKILFGTSNPVLPLACSGTGAMTAAVYSLFNPGEKVLVVEAGKFGERWREIAISRNLEVISLPVEWGTAVKSEQVFNALEKNRDLAGVLMQLCETSTGTLQPVWAVSEAMQATNALLVVDGISAVGISPAPMDEWRLDCLLTGSQKGLMLPPGLALLSLSERAWKKTEKVKPGCFYFNLPKERENLKKGQTLFTSPVNLVEGLNASLDLLLNNGLEAIYAKQWALTMLTRAGAEAMGLELLAKEDFSWGVTAICLPDGLDATKILAEIQSRFGIVMAGGQDSLKGRIIRIGHMGWVDWSDCLAALAALGFTLEKLGNFSIAPGYLEKALNAYETALKSYENKKH